MIYLILTLFLGGAIIAYFKVANYFNIIDKPNERSSHTEVTIRGGGIIFLFATVIFAVIHSEYWLLVAATFIIGFISFLDDILTLSSRVRLMVHLAAVSIMFFYLALFNNQSVYIVVLLYIMVVGVINMYNFMDGINGITGLYSLVVLLGLQYVNINQISFITADAIWIPALACLIFLYFNCRKKAKCFAGDVGSVTIAFWIIGLLLKLIFQTHNWSYILFLSVYGVDSVLTIIHRLLLKQNIFKAHRLHLYQLLVNEAKAPHLVISSCYALIQLIIIAIVINNLIISGPYLALIILVPMGVVYLMLKAKLMTKTAGKTAKEF